MARPFRLRSDGKEYSAGGPGGRGAATGGAKPLRRPWGRAPPGLLLVLGRCHLKLVDDVDALGAHGLAQAALDAGASAAIGGLPAIEALHELVVARHGLQVQQLHDLRDPHARRAVLHAVVAAGARRHR